MIIEIPPAPVETKTDDNVVPIQPWLEINTEGLTFSEALEKAFWAVGGVAFLTKVARDQPLEFLKICAKLIPAEMKAMDSNAGVSITINTYEEPNSGPIYNQPED